MTAVSEFDREIAVTGRADQPGAYDAELGEGWRIGGGVNGGLLLALAGHALRRELGPEPPTAYRRHPDPLAISAYYLTPGVPGPAERAHVRSCGAGAAVSTGQVSLLQGDGAGGDGRAGAVLATYGDLASRGRRRQRPPPRRRSSPAGRVRLGRPGAAASFLKHASLLERLDLRLDPATTGWAVGKPSGNGVIRGWLRMADGREPDPLMLLLAVDALPPVAFELGLPGWTPTLELTAHVRAGPRRAGCGSTSRAAPSRAGYLEEDAEVWDSEGRLVALSRQLATGAPSAAAR